MRRLLIFFHAKSFHVRLALALLLTAFSGYALAGSWAKVADGYGYTFALKTNGTSEIFYILDVNKLIIFAT